MTAEEFYGNKYPLMKQAEEHLLGLIKKYETEIGVQADLQPIIYTCSRIKEPSNMLAKLERKGLEKTLDAALYQVYDVLGVRAVCAFAEDVYRFVFWLREQADLEIVEERDYFRYPKSNGYRSYHLRVRFPDGECKGIQAEIQVRTIANDFWATLEHRLHYKKTVPHENVVQEELKRCAFEIASVDASMQAIRDLLKTEI